MSNRVRFRSRIWIRTLMIMTRRIWIRTKSVWNFGSTNNTWLSYASIFTSWLVRYVMVEKSPMNLNSPFFLKVVNLLKKSTKINQNVQRGASRLQGQSDGYRSFILENCAVILRKFHIIFNMTFPAGAQIC